MVPQVHTSPPPSCAGRLSSQILEQEEVAGRLQVRGGVAMVMGEVLALWRAVEPASPQCSSAWHLLCEVLSSFNSTCCPATYLQPAPAHPHPCESPFERAPPSPQQAKGRNKGKGPGKPSLAAAAAAAADPYAEQVRAAACARKWMLACCLLEWGCCSAALCSFISCCKA